MPAVVAACRDFRVAPITLSRSVVPDRGMPTMKIGVGPCPPHMRRCRHAAEDRDQLRRIPLALPRS